MTILTTKDGDNVSQRSYGLEYIDEPTANAMRLSRINMAVKHMVIFLKGRLTEQGVTGVDVKAVFPELPKDTTTEELISNIKAPAILVGLRLSTTSSTMDQFFADAEEGTAYYYNQIAYFEFDCFGINTLSADQVAGWVDEELQMEKAHDLSRKGFQDFQTVFSAPQHGFDYRLQWDFKEFYYKLKILRHIVHVRTSFDVVWVKKGESSGIISQVVFEDETEFDFNFSQGYNLSYLYAEEQFLGWHDVIA